MSQERSRGLLTLRVNVLINIQSALMAIDGYYHCNGPLSIGTAISIRYLDVMCICCICIQNTLHDSAVSNAFTIHFMPRDFISLEYIKTQNASATTLMADRSRFSTWRLEPLTFTSWAISITVRPLEV